MTTSIVGSGSAVAAYTSGSGNALYAVHNGSSGSAANFHVTSASNYANALFVSTAGTGYSGYFTGGNGLYVEGNLKVTGLKNFVQPHPADPSKEVAYVALEGPESAVFLRGRARLENGRASIETPEYFRIAAGRDEDVTVQFTPRSSKSRGLAAVSVTKETVLVEELLEGTGSYEFDYFITAKRAGFEEHEPVRNNTSFTADNMTKEEFEQRYARDDMATRAVKAMLVSNGILSAEGKLNMDVARSLGWKMIP